MGSMKSNEWGLLLILAVFWGGSFFFVEVALRDFQPFTLVFLRISIAALILAGVVYLSGKRLPASLKTWMGYIVMGLVNIAIPFSLIVWGQTRIEGGVASILNATTPIFTMLLATFLIPISALLLGVGVLGEVIKVFEYAGMGCIFLGLIIIDGRALKWLLRISGPTENEKGEEIASKVVS